MRSDITNNVAGRHHHHPIIITIPGYSFTYKHETKHLACQMGIPFPRFKEAYLYKTKITAAWATDSRTQKAQLK